MIDVKPGYQLLRGPDALAFSRYRHTDSDFYRNARQQTFLRAFEQRAASRFHGVSITDLPDIKSLLDTISHNVQIGAHGGAPSVRTFIKYATLAPSLAGHFVSSRLEATTGMEGTASVVFATPEAIHKAVYRFTHPADAGVADRPASDRQEAEEAQEAQVQAGGRSVDRGALGAERHDEGR